MYIDHNSIYKSNNRGKHPGGEYFEQALQVYLPAVNRASVGAHDIFHPLPRPLHGTVTWMCSDNTGDRVNARFKPATWQRMNSNNATLSTGSWVRAAFQSAGSSTTFTSSLLNMILAHMYGNYFSAASFHWFPLSF